MSYADFNEFYDNLLRNQLAKPLPIEPAEPATRSGPAAVDELKPVFEEGLMAGPPTGNTGASSSQSSGRQVGGLDWLAVSVRGTWAASELSEHYWSRLEAAKEQAAADWQSVAIELGSRKFIVHPYSARHQNGQAVICCECEGVTFHFSKREQATRGNRPLCWLQMSSLALMMAGDWWQLWEQTVCTLRFLGVRIETTIVSRFDICVDLPGYGMHEFGEHYRHDAYICKATNDDWRREHKRVTGLTFGVDLMCRIYDKLLEVQRDQIKQQVMIENRWGGEEPEAAVRVEFEVKRDALREKWGVTTVEDLREKLKDITHELTHEWLRFTEQTVDRENKHQSRAVVWSVWEMVQELFQQVVGGIGQRLPRPLKDIPEPMPAMKQGIGCFMSALVARGQWPSSASDFVQKVASLVACYMPDDWWERLNERQDEFEARVPAFCAPGVVPRAVA